MNSSANPGGASVPLSAVVLTDEFYRRPSRPPDYEAEARALAALAQELGHSPQSILQTLVDTSLSLCKAHSAGISLLEEKDGVFRWPAIAGEWAQHIGGTTPRDFSPCGVVLDSNSPQLFSRFDRYYPYFSAVSMPAYEALLTPFYVGEKAVGTVWVVSHHERRQFEPEDLRLLSSIGKFASATFGLLSSLEAHTRVAESLRQSEERARLALDAARLNVSKQQIAEGALRDADRLKDEFLATLSHELRNPLAPVRNAIYTLRQGLSDASVVSRLHEIIERQVTKLIRIVDDLLDISRVTQGKLELRKERVDLVTVVQGAMETIRHQVDVHGHQLSLAVSVTELWALVDPARIEQVVVNLLDNAAKYSPRRSTILISLEEHNDTAVIRVKDNGSGIPVDMLPHIFSKFAQAGQHKLQREGGHGLGLPLVRQLVDLHGGRVEAQSAGLGHGSEFTVVLPREVPSRTPVQANVLEPCLPESDPCHRVLVVDDDVDAAETTAAVARQWGHDVVTAKDGHTALEQAVRFRPDVVLLDIGLPDLSGYELAPRLRTLPGMSKTLSLVALTGYGADSDRTLAKEAGFDHHMTKPVVIEALRALLRSIAPGQAPK